MVRQAGPITVNPAALDEFTMTGIPAAVTAGDNFPNSVTVTAFDVYGNTKTNYTGSVYFTSTDAQAQLTYSAGNAYTFNGGDNGVHAFPGSAFELRTVGNRTITVRDDAPNPDVTLTSGQIAVSHSTLSDVTLSIASGYTQTAGTPFTLDATNARDAYGNAWSGTLTVSAFSGGGNSPGGNSPTYNDIAVTGGGGSADQTLVNAVATILRASADGETRYTPAITVNPASLSDYSLSATTPQTAGIGFALSVTNAIDGYGNSWSGTMNVDISAGGGNAPDGTSPSLNNIVVNNGFGSATQTLTNAVNTTFHGSSGGIDRYTGSIQVLPGALAEFTLEGTPTAVVAGNIFPGGVTVTAFDSYRNRKTNYTGIVYFTSTDGQAQLTYNVGSPYIFTGGDNGLHTFPGSAFQLRTAGTFTITVRDDAPNPDVTKTSAPITVTHAGVNVFNLSCGTTQYAGVAFSLSVSGAQDAYGNNWSGTVTISASAGGGNSPNGFPSIFNAISVTNGAGQANQTLVRAEGGVALQGQAGGVTRTVSGITVNPNIILASMKIRDAAGGGGSEVVSRSMAVGSVLSLYAAGYDAYGNYRGDESSNWTSTGLTPVVQVNGTPFLAFQPTAPGNGTITATAPTGITDHTGTITVYPGTLSYFSVEVSGSVQRVDHPFSITVTARDAQANVATDFTGQVIINDLTGSIRPAISTNFEAGVWNGGVTISQPRNGNIITVTQVGGAPPAGGTSAPFNVIPSPGVRVARVMKVKADTLTPLQSVTTDQEVDWYLWMVMENLGSDAVTLDSATVTFIVNGFERTDYAVQIPGVFWSSGNAMLPGVSEDSLLIKVDRVGHDAGPATIQCVAYMTSSTGSALEADGFTNFTVETPAALVITKVVPSRQEVTQDQDSVWTAVVIITNGGESDVLIDSAAVDTALSFSSGIGWEVGRPDALNRGDWVLGGGETDTLEFDILNTGDGATGECLIHASLRGIEINTGRSLLENTQDLGWGTVTLETPASLRIIRTTNLAMNAPYVNALQDFSVRILIENSGGDGLHDVSITLATDGLSLVPAQPIPTIASLAGGRRDSVDVRVQSHSLPNESEILTANAVGYADNTGSFRLSENPIDDTARVIIQVPAELTIVNAYPSVAQVQGGQVEPWTVNVIVQNGTNTNHAALLLDPPEATDLTFWADGSVFQSDYRVDPPAALKGGGLQLNGGDSDTLVYTVAVTGNWGGSVEIRALIQGWDANTAEDIGDLFTTNVLVLANPSFRIISTRIRAYNTTLDGTGTVNIGQSFVVVVLVENGMGESASDIWVGLEGDGTSIITESPLNIARLGPAERDSVVFEVTAGTNENLAGETFSATITGAKLEASGLPASIGPAIDSTTLAIIQTPASLSLAASLSNPSGQFTTNQPFMLRARLTNHGTSSVDAGGRVRLRLPPEYFLSPTESETMPINTVDAVVWNLLTPSQEQATDRVSVELYQIPLDKNTGQPAIVLQDRDSVDVTTNVSWLTASVSVSSPAGAIDDTLSTGQNFVISALMDWQNVEDIIVQIYLPFGYTIDDNAMKSVVTQEVLWNVKAPSIEMGTSYIEIRAQGVNIYDETREIHTPAASVPVYTVPRADLLFTLTSSDHSVALGQEFIVTAQVVNNGVADTLGVTRAGLHPLPDGYTTNDPYVKDMINGQAFWTINAPSEPSQDAVNIEARLVAIPIDENTGDSVFVSKRSDEVAVTTVGGWLSVSQFFRPDTVSGLVIPGDSLVWLMGLEFVNRGETGANAIVIGSLGFVVENTLEEEVNPGDIFTQVRAVRAFREGGVPRLDLDRVYGVSSRNALLEGNPVFIDYIQTDRITAKDTSLVVLLGTIADTDQTLNFRLSIPNGTYVEATDEYAAGLPVSVLDVSGQEFVNIQSDPKQILPNQWIQPEAGPYLLNCPNPFGEPGNEETVFVYYLKENTDVSFRIFTLTGGLVWSRSYSAADPQGAQGLHSMGMGAVGWDGRNDNGLRVLNGVYILVMDTGYGDIAKTKVAYVK